MRAVLCKAFGPIENVSIADIPVPAVGKGEVMIKAAYCGVNFPDTLIVQGKYQFRPELPFVPGGELSGEIVKVGPGVEGLKEGDRVLAAMGWGAYGEYAVAKAANIFRIPRGVDLRSAAALLESYATAIHALQDRAKLQQGETMVVLGASGGTGTAAVQLGKQMGARVIAAVSAPDKAQFAGENGADKVINYAEKDLKAELKASGGVDVVFDPVGGELAEAAFRSIRPGGRHLVVGFASGRIPALPWNLPLLKSAAITGVFWGHFWRTEPDANRANVAKLLDWLQEGRINPPVSREYPLDRAVDALQDIANRRAKGKLVLAVDF